MKFGIWIYVVVNVYVFLLYICYTLKETKNTVKYLRLVVSEESSYIFDHNVFVFFKSGHLS